MEKLLGIWQCETMKTLKQVNVTGYQALRKMEKIDTI